MRFSQEIEYGIFVKRALKRSRLEQSGFKRQLSLTKMSVQIMQCADCRL